MKSQNKIEVKFNLSVVFKLFANLLTIVSIQGFYTSNIPAQTWAFSKEIHLTKPFQRGKYEMLFGFGGGAKGSSKKSGGSNEMPKLYDAWFKKSGELERAVLSSTKACLAKNQRVEVYFNPVPNLDEVKFGTPLNQAFGIEIANDLGAPEYKPGSLVKRYLLEFSQLYWAKKLADGLPGTVWILSFDGLKKDPITKPGKGKYIYFKTGQSFGKESTVKSGETIIVVNPGPTANWKKAIQEFPDQKLVFLNNLVSENYNLGGPLEEVEQAYYLKRISKGYVLRKYPSSWKSYLEDPEGKLEVMSSFDEKPQLREVSEEVRKESMNRYGIFNDRFAKGFGARL
mmetsp:Transcript_16724/g.22115  ORF Transcript_16724/g.22115 Transcript_16724/m.22115 type:complete len:341 (+) Transcript_16724:155-1177(+)